MWPDMNKSGKSWMKLMLKNKYKSYLLIEMPEYLKPQLKTVLISVWNNVRSFVWNAGKIILATSIVLFVLATNGGSNFNNARAEVLDHRHSDQA